jgi:hypothetical protein
MRWQRNGFDGGGPYSDEIRAQKYFTMHRWKTKAIAGAMEPLGSPDHRWIEDVVEQMIKISE